MISQNTICAIIGIAVPTPKCGRVRSAFGDGTFVGHIVPILQGTLVRELFNPQGVLRR